MTKSTNHNPVFERYGKAVELQEVIDSQSPHRVDCIREVGQEVFIGGTNIRGESFKIAVTPNLDPSTVLDALNRGAYVLKPIGPFRPQKEGLYNSLRDGYRSQLVAA